MRWLFRWLFRGLLLLIVVGVAAVLLKDTAAKALVEWRLQQQTGFEARVRRVEVGLTSPTLTFEGVRLFNPEAFGGGPFLDLPDLHIEYVPEAVRRGELRLKLLRLDLAELRLVESADGRTNVLALKERIEARAKQASKVSRFEPRFSGIETLNLSVGRIGFESLKTPARRWNFEVGLRNEVVREVRSEADLSGLLVRVLLKRGLDLMLPRGAGKPTNGAPSAPVVLGPGGGAPGSGRQPGADRVPSSNP
jgi:hypothetical protein